MTNALSKPSRLMAGQTTSYHSLKDFQSSKDTTRSSSSKQFLQPWMPHMWPPSADALHPAEVADLDIPDDSANQKFSFSFPNADLETSLPAASMLRHQRSHSPVERPSHVPGHRRRKPDKINSNNIGMGFKLASSSANSARRQHSSPSQRMQIRFAPFALGTMHSPEPEDEIVHPIHQNEDHHRLGRDINLEYPFTCVDCGLNCTSFDELDAHDCASSNDELSDPLPSLQRRRPSGDKIKTITPTALLRPIPPEVTLGRGPRRSSRFPPQAQLESVVYGFPEYDDIPSTTSAPTEPPPEKPTDPTSKPARGSASRKRKRSASPSPQPSAVPEAPPVELTQAKRKKPNATPWKKKYRPPWKYHCFGDGEYSYVERPYRHPIDKLLDEWDECFPFRDHVSAMELDIYVPAEPPVPWPEVELPEPLVPSSEL